MSIALCLLAAAIWLSAGRSRRGDVPGVASSAAAITASRRWARSPAVLRWSACGAVLVGAIAVLGPARGGVLGMVAMPLTWWLIGRAQARDVRRAPPGSARRVPLVLDLLAAALRAGQPVASALAAVAALAGEHWSGQLRQVAGLLRFGADPATAWAPLADTALAPLARTACRSAESGVRLARGFELLAAELRDESRAAAVARAHRAGVWAMAPLGLCFLPAFACLGVLPVIAGIANGVLSGAAP